MTHRERLQAILDANIEVGTKPAVTLRILRSYIATYGVAATATLDGGVITLAFPE